jgi:uncharacterized protein YndB with AHSA1/START domain
MIIEIETTILAKPNVVWESWTTPSDICQWNAASDDWHTTSAELELAVGSSFSYRMEAKDGSMGFDFTGTYTRIDPETRIDFELDDARTVSTTFELRDEGVLVKQRFDTEDELSAEQQRTGWQSILDRFALHCETKNGI